MAIPKLRFKDLGEDWTAKKLSQVANLTSSKRVHLSDYVSEGIPFFRGKEITELKSGIFPKDILYISKKQYEDFKEKFGAPQNNEILMTAVGTLANTYLINTDFEFYFKDGNLIWFKDINADPNFLMILLDARKNDVLASAIGSTQKALTIANLNKLIFNFPSKEEQTKIASFLSGVDEKIAQLTQKHELLSQYKQGMMQKLFNQQIRFKANDGSEFGEWASEKISKVFTNKSKSFNPLLNESLPCIELEHLSQNTGQILGTVNSSDQQSTKNLFEPNSVLYGKLRPYLRKFAKPQFKGVCSSEIWVLTGLKISNDYLFQFVQSEQFTELTNIQSGSKMPRADWNVIADAEIEFPCLGEQTKIANFLSAIDQKIEVTEQQIEQAKQWKKGLLQQMFV